MISPKEPASEPKMTKGSGFRIDVFRDDKEYYIADFVHKDGEKSRVAVAKTLEAARKTEGSWLIMEGNDGALQILLCRAADIQASREMIGRIFDALNDAYGDRSKEEADMYFVLPDDESAKSAVQALEQASAADLDKVLLIEGLFEGDSSENLLGMTPGNLRSVIEKALFEADRAALEELERAMKEFRQREEEIWGQIESPQNPEEEQC